MKNISKLMLTMLSIGVLSGCVSEYYAPPTSGDCISPKLTANKTIASVWAIAVNPTIPAGSISPNTPTYTNSVVNTEDIIEGYVISSDEGGNFYKSMYFQPLDKSRGFNLSADVSFAYTKKFTPGKKVYLKLNGLAFANPTSFASGLTFGAKPTDKYTVDRLATSDLDKSLIASCDAVSEDLLVNGGLTINQAKSDIYMNTLVELKNTQFKSDCTTYSGKEFDTSLKLTDASGATLDLRTSRFAGFAGNYVPSGSGTIRGVLTKFGSGYQIVIRTERDVKFNNPRIGQVPTPPKIGASSNVFNATLNENFTSYANATAAAFPKYVNQVDIGSKYWDVTSFGTPVNRYIQTSAFNNGCTKNYFVVPVDFSAANGLSFKTLDGYNNGIPLKVYYSKDYNPGANMSQATLVDISSNFLFADGRPATATSYGSGFTSSGTYSIPNDLIGIGYFIFEYDGTSGITTTMQIDDIIIN